MSKRILYLTPGCFDKGGISRYNRYQIRLLLDTYGNDYVKVISLLGPGEDSIEEEIKTDWHGMDNLFFSKIIFTFVFVKYLFLWKPSLVIVTHVNLSGIVWMFSKIFKYKTMLNIYGLEIWSKLSWDAYLGFRNVDVVVSDCHFSARFAEGLGFREDGTVKVVWDCIDLNKFEPVEGPYNDIEQKYGLPPKKGNSIILSLGRLSEDASHKGYDRLLKVFGDVARESPKVFLVLAGKGNLVPILKEKANKLGIADKVYFPGSIHEQDLKKIYSYADIFSLVSDRDIDRGEGIPLTPLEAMACGTPIIVGNQDGSAEAIFNNENGISIDPFDYNAHRFFILKLIKNQQLILEYSKSARMIAEKYFSYELFSKQYEDIINCILIDE